MYVFWIMLAVCIALAVGIAAVVAVGMKGLFREQNPALSRLLAKAATHLNGDAEPPAQLERLLESTRR